MQAIHLVELMVNPPLRYWSGQGELVYAGKTYQGANKLQFVGQLEQRPTKPSKRMEVHISVKEDARLLEFLQDRGPFGVTVHYLGREGPGGAVVLLPVKFVGRASSPAIVQRLLKLELETLKGDVDRGVVLYWSHEDQQARFPDDRGLEYMRKLAEEGIDTTWPP